MRRRRMQNVSMFMLGLVCLALYNGMVMSISFVKLQKRQNMMEMTDNNNISANESGSIGSQFPPDLFSLEQKRMGAIILHILGVVYMFIGIALICDEFFVPSLDNLSAKLKLSEDVAGATFMAAGGSAPEFFVSLFGIFFARNSIGFGTVVGSAVFNIMFVIGACALLSRKKLKLTWWPLFRDTLFYVVALATLIGFFQGGSIEWYESLVMFLLYILYVLFMSVNKKVEKSLDKVKNKIKRLCHCLRKNIRVNPDPIPFQKQVSANSSTVEISQHVKNIQESQENNPSSFLSVTKTSIQLSHDFGIQSRANSPMLHVFGTTAPGLSDSISKQGDTKDIKKHRRSSIVSRTSNSSTQIDSTVNVQVINVEPAVPDIVSEAQKREEMQQEQVETENEEEGEEIENESIFSLWPPKGRNDRILYVFYFPFIVLFCLTLPDVRKQRWKNWFFVTFIGSVVWIGILSYFMVWWATELGITLEIPPSVMGYTLLAAGTSIPDLITSVIVARKGRGDMAVSSSIGSNMFDVTVGLPVPWLLYSAVNNGESVDVFSSGLFCSVILLFAMLVAAIATLGLSKWTLTKLLGVIFILYYIVFITLGILLELVIHCSIS